METLFEISFWLVAPFWILMILLPSWPATERVVRSPWIAAAACLVYAVLVIPRIGVLGPALLTPRLSTIAPLLGQPDGATIAWIHFLAFDLFVGRFIYLDARQRGISHWLVSPVLALTLMFGPAGFLSYLLCRLARAPSNA